MLRFEDSKVFKDKSPNKFYGSKQMNQNRKNETSAFNMDAHINPVLTNPNSIAMEKLKFWFFTFKRDGAQKVRRTDFIP